MYALKVTGLAPRDKDEWGHPVRGARREESWLFAMDGVASLKSWMAQLKDVTRDLAPSQVQIGRAHV